jgi:glycerol kinase
MNIEPEFTKEQLEYIQKTLNEELGKIKNEIDKNYIPRIMVEGMLEGMLEVTKEMKSKCDTKFRELFVDGAIWALQEVLKED